MCDFFFYNLGPLHSLPPATKLGQGNVFTPVCHSVCHTPSRHHPPGRHPVADTPRVDTPHAQCMLDMDNKRVGTHPTRMQSRLSICCGPVSLGHISTYILQFGQERSSGTRKSGKSHHSDHNHRTLLIFPSH